MSTMGRNLIGQALMQALGQLGQGLGQRHFRDQEQQRVQGILNQLQGQRDQSVVQPGIPELGILGSTTSTQRPMFSEQNLGLLNQLPKETLALLGMVQPQYMTAAPGTEIFEKGSGGLRKVGGVPPRPDTSTSVFEGYLRAAGGDMGAALQKYQADQIEQRKAGKVDISFGAPIQDRSGNIRIPTRNAATGKVELQDTGVQGQPPSKGGSTSSSTDAKFMSEYDVVKKNLAELTNTVTSKTNSDWRSWVGPVAGGVLAPLGSMANRLPGKRERFRGLVAKVKNKTLNLLSGAAVSEHEMKRIEQELPTENDNENAFVEKLQLTKENVEYLLARYKFYRRTSGGDETGGTVSESPVLAPGDQEAVDWAKQNPNDPRAQQILKMHGIE